MRSLPACLFASAVCFVPAAAGQTARSAAERRDPPPIQDNSFLLEEAYNQEPGVVQHISAFTRDQRTGEWMYAFTQEWPVPRQMHQFSFTIPFQRVDVEGGSDSGLGDIALNYRYQLVGDSDARLAVAPRASLLLPTGDPRRGLGAGSAALQISLPASIVLSPRFVGHVNVGWTWTPRAESVSGERADTFAYSVGESVVFHGSRTFDLIVEALWTRAEAVVGAGKTGRSDSALISPGVRWAWNTRRGLQIVPGIGFPIGVGPSRGERSLLLYLSFEHPFRREPAERH